MVRKTANVVLGLLVSSAIGVRCNGPTETDIVAVCQYRPGRGFGLQFRLQDGTNSNAPFLNVRTEAVDGEYNVSSWVVDSLARGGPDAIYGLLSLAPRAGTYT